MNKWYSKTIYPFEKQTTVVEDVVDEKKRKFQNKTIQIKLPKQQQGLGEGSELEFGGEECVKLLNANK